MADIGGADDCPDLTTEARLAAFVIEHGASVLSFDRDFARFNGLQRTLPADD